MGTVKEPKTTGMKPTSCVFDGTPLKDWTERNTDLFVRSSTVCKSCSALYVSTLDKVAYKMSNQARLLDGRVVCIDCKEHLQARTVNTEVVGLLDFLRQSPRTTPLQVMECPGCESVSNERMEPVLISLR